MVVILLTADTYSSPFSEAPPPVATSALACCDDVGVTAGWCRTVHGELSADELHVLKSISDSKTHQLIIIIIIIIYILLITGSVVVLW